MPKVMLNDKSIRRPPPKSGQEELWDLVLPGFGLRIAAGGSRTYFVMRRLGSGGPLTRRTIGKAPPPDTSRDAKLAAGELWAHEAREVARDFLAKLERGIDPKAEAIAAQAREAEENALSFKAVAEKYLSDKLAGGGAELRTRTELERKLKVDLKAWHGRPIGEIRGRDIRELVRLKAQESPIAANRLLSFIKRVFRWAASQDYIDADPAAGVDKPGRENRRERFLSEDEIRLFWKACDLLGEPAGRLFKLALVTGQRRGEVAGLRRSELGRLEYRAKDPRTGRDRLQHGEAWLLPPERTKRGVAHTVFLSPLAVQIIEGSPRLETADGKAFDHVFPSGRRGDQPVTGWSRFKERLDELMGRIAAQEAGEEYDPAKHNIAPWHIHDLRATVATYMDMDRLAVPRPVISRVLNHSEGDGRSMTARYTRHRWDAEAADALNAWAAELARIVGLNVVALSGGAA